MINIKKRLICNLLLGCFFITNTIQGQKINQFDKNNKRTGIWKKYYSNKKIRYVGEFKNGKEVGIFTFYDKTSSKFPVVIKKFSSDSDTVFVQFFTLKGKLRSEGKMVEKRRVGKWMYYFTDGKLFSEENYIDGKLNGELINYYKNQKITEHTIYKNGLKHGLSKKYSNQGILIEEVMFHNGKANGLAKYFELNGVLKEKGIYKNGKRIGKWNYYINGTIVTEK